MIELGNELVVVAGARPNFMKVAPVLAELGRRQSYFRARLVHTGQHYDEQMSGVFFAQLGLPAPDVHLGVGAGSHGAQTGRILEAFERYLLARAEPPAGALVVGDVNSTMACALAAVKLGIPVAHLEAGLRSRDRSMPEEINRLVTDAVSDLLLVSEPSGEANLLAEGIPGEKIHFVGNVMIDTLARELPAARALNAWALLGLERGGYALITLHRPSNVDDAERLASLTGLLCRISRRLPVVFPAHPRTRQRLEQTGLISRIESAGGIYLSGPLAYRENLSLQEAARFVLTDSGGIQEETSFLAVPCLTLRPSTERPVTVSLGTNTLVTGDPAAADGLVEDILAGRYKKGSPIPGWDGQASRRVVDVLSRAWSADVGY